MEANPKNTLSLDNKSLSSVGGVRLRRQRLLLLFSKDESPGWPFIWAGVRAEAIYKTGKRTDPKNLYTEQDPGPKQDSL